MAVERAEWPDWGACFLNDEAPLAALAAAIEERAAAAGVGVSGLWSGTPAPTVLSRLAAAAAALETHAPVFVDLDNPANAWTWSSHAPLSFRAQPRGTEELPVSSIYEGEHSLAAFSPGIGAPEAHEPTLAAYRKFLADCAWWLESFRYVDVGREAVYLTKIVRDRDGNTTASDVQTPAKTRRAGTVALFHETQYSLTVKGQTRYEYRTAVQLARLRVANPAPLAGQAVFVYGLPQGDLDRLERALTIDRDERGILRASTGEIVEKRRVADQTVQVRRKDIVYRNPSGGDLVRRTDWTDTSWSVDGTLSADMTYSTAEGDSYGTPTASRGLVLPAHVAPLELASPWTRLSLSATIPANGTVTFFDDMTDCPVPADLAGWEGLLPDSPATLPGVDTWRHLGVDARAYLEIFLDYNDSFRYRAADEEEV